MDRISRLSVVCSVGVVMLPSGPFDLGGVSRNSGDSANKFFLLCGNVVLGRILCSVEWGFECGTSESDLLRRCCVGDDLCGRCQV